MGTRVTIRPDVASALAQGRAVVALETTLVTHGFPAPEGVDVALSLERDVREHGAVPATIGVVGGRLQIGLSEAELRGLAESGAAKLNLSNLAAEMAGGGSGSTTVSATLWAAARAGIRVFATGGIGGVHRGDTDDVSADLTALARFPVAVVCAGAKAILDLPRTLERLETLGVPVLGLGTLRFPAFYRRDSGLPVDRGFDTLDALAETVGVHLELGLGGVLVANPIPEEYELPRDVYEVGLERALAAAETARVRGRDVTPFLLDRMRALTEGASVFSNRALLRHNARTAAMLATLLARQESS